VGYAKQAFGGPVQVLRYLGCYTHRIAISNRRLLAFDGERVTFRYKDYAHDGKQRIMTLNAPEFLRRFFLQPAGTGRSPPQDTTRARHSGRRRSPLALSQVRRAHVCRSKTHCCGAVLIELS